MKKIICALLAATLAASLAMTGCQMSGSTTSSQQPNQNNGSSVSPQQSNQNNGNNSVQDNANTPSNSSSLTIKSSLLKSYSADDMAAIERIMDCKTGFYYSTAGSGGGEGLYGIINSETNEILNAEYTVMEPASGREKDFYKCTKAKSANSVKEMNAFGLLDSTGKELIPLQYASIDVLNDHFAKVVTVDGKTTSKDDALVYQNSGLSIGVNDDSTLYTGKWQIYDLDKGTIVPNLEGKKADNIDAKGKLLKIGSDYYEAGGNKLDMVDNVFNNGCYTVDSGGVTHVNDTDSNKLFQVNSSIAVNQASDDSTEISFVEYDGKKRVIVNESGEKISAEFEKSITKAGNFCFEYKDDNYIMYDLQANKVYNESISNYDYNKTFGLYDIKDKNKQHTYLNKSGQKIGSVAEGEGVNVDKGVVFKSSGNSRSIYSYADNSFSLEADRCDTVAPFVYSNNKGAFNVLNKATVINEDYIEIKTNGNGLAICKKSDGSADLFKITVE